MRAAEGTTEDEVVGWHHRLNGHEFEQTLGDSEGQGSLAFYSPRVRKELDTTATEQRQIGDDSVTSQVTRDQRNRMGGFIDRPLGEKSVNRNSFILVTQYIYKFLKMLYVEFLICS